MTMAHNAASGIADQGAGDVLPIWRRMLKMRETGLIIIILALFIGMSFASPYFLTWANIRAMSMAFS